MFNPGPQNRKHLDQIEHVQRRPQGWREAERAGVVQPEEEKAVGKPYSDIPVPKGSLQERQGGTFYTGMQ